MGTQVIDDLQNNTNQKANQHNDNRYWDIPGSFSVREHVPNHDHDAVFNVNDGVVENVAQPRVAVLQIQVGKHVHSSDDNVEKEFLAFVAMAEICALPEDPHQHDNGVCSAQYCHPECKLRGKERQRQNSGRNDEHVPEELQGHSQVGHVGLVFQRQSQCTVIGH